MTTLPLFQETGNQSQRILLTSLFGHAATPRGLTRKHLTAQSTAISDFVDAFMPAARNRLGLHDRLKISGTTIIFLSMR